MMIIGLSLLLFVFLLIGTLAFFSPAVAEHLAPLAELIVKTVGTLVAVYCGVQAAVDFKAATP